MTQPLMLVTGGSRGIGAATVLLALTRGWRVAFSYRDNAEAANTVVSQARAMGAEVLAFKADVSNATDVLQLFETVEQRLGAVSALINNAGMLEQQMRL
ncbi:MAG: SDR family NAD(P)-dependent oxidoreductase, partial [Burkholderiaceae bacterium]